MKGDHFGAPGGLTGELHCGLVSLGARVAEKGELVGTGKEAGDVFGQLALVKVRGVPNLSGLLENVIGDLLVAVAKVTNPDPAGEVKVGLTVFIGEVPVVAGNDVNGVLVVGIKNITHGLLLLSADLVGQGGP